VTWRNSMNASSAKAKGLFTGGWRIRVERKTKNCVDHKGRLIQSRF
jgi:hypothetical protein